MKHSWPSFMTEVEAVLLIALIVVAAWALTR